MLREHPVELARIEGVEVEELLGNGQKEAVALKPGVEPANP
jgi:hypothetical protein